VSLVTVETRGDSVRFQVRLQPRASRNEISGVQGGALRVRLHAPPVDGAANEALVDFLAGRLAVPRRGVRIVAGATSRTKMIEVHGVTSADVERLADEQAEAGTR
jgi:uncharacterized protein (TIGR00251 family)